MGGILNSLNTSYTGLQTHQVMVDTAGNNIANANDEFYSRQKVVAKPSMPLDKNGYHIGSGVEVESIVRAHDEFIFQRYERAAQEKELFQTQYDKLRETASLFPDLEGVGIYDDLHQYFNAWKNVGKDVKDPAQKQLLIQATQTLLRSIHATHKNLTEMQNKTSQELAIRIAEVNRIGEQIVHINQQLSAKEWKVDLSKANDLRDQRDRLEFQLKELIGGSVFKKNLKTDIGIDSRDIDYGENYVYNVAGGFNFIDGNNLHPLSTKDFNQANGLNHIYFQNQDHHPVDISSLLIEGKIGGLLKIYSDGSNGTPPGKLQKYIDMVNVFAQTFIEASNTIYAQSSIKQTESNHLDLSLNQSLVDSKYNIHKGTFDLVLYNSNGEEVGVKTIIISPTTTIKDIIEQINTSTDDNGDQNSLNDVDDYFYASFDSQSGKFQLSAKNQENVYISFKDNGSNFAGALGINRLFDGNDASNISLNSIYLKDPAKIRQWGSPASGNTDVANAMQQMQYDELAFFQNKDTVQHLQLSQYYRLLGGEIATDTQAIQTSLNTKNALFASTKKEYESISQVSIEEEMVNLIKFQSGYSANAKVVSTIDKMIDTLLGIKQ